MFDNKKLTQFINDKFVELSIEVRDYFDSVYGKVNSTHEDVDSVKNHLGAIESMNEEATTTILDSINNVYESLSDEIKTTDRVPLMIYEDLSKLQKDSTKEFADVNKKLSQITWLGDKVKEILNDIKELRKLEESWTEVEPQVSDECDELRKENAALKRLNNELSAANTKLAKSIESLDASFAMVTQGIYNQDNIEFAAVKTYREGWKYLCYNGRQLTNFDGISQISLNWDSCEKYLNMDISFTGEN